MTGEELTHELFADHERYAARHVTPALCTYEPVGGEVRESVGRSKGLLTLTEVGTSLEGRTLYTVRFGRGVRRILLWSQMHGDEPTATLALLDLFRYLVAEQQREHVQLLLNTTTVVCLPMLNPDGAERYQRESAVQIDLNRDANMLATPEARVLRDVHEHFSPEIAFNLHDQSLSSVGESNRVAALSLLAPPFNAQRSIDPTRQRAMRVAACISRFLSPLAHGHITRYSDDYESRAFGDRIQSWGTSTVLIESGHWPLDIEKHFVRKLNFAAILAAILTIGNGTLDQTDLKWYDDLEPNGKRLFDIIVRGVALTHPTGWTERVDVGLLVEPRRNSPGGPWPQRAVVKAVGDLQSFGALQELRAPGASQPVETVAIDRSVDLTEIALWGSS